MQRVYESLAVCAIFIFIILCLVDVVLAMMSSSVCLFLDFNFLVYANFYSNSVSNEGISGLPVQHSVNQPTADLFLHFLRWFAPSARFNAHRIRQNVQLHRRNVNGRIVLAKN